MNAAQPSATDVAWRWAFIVFTFPLLIAIASMFDTVRCGLLLVGARSARCRVEFWWEWFIRWYKDGVQYPTGPK